MTSRATYEFGGYRFEPHNARLVRDDRVIPLTVKTTDLLLVLVQHADVLVSKDDLISAVWPGTAVEENNLNQQISALRKVLASPDGHAVTIETVPKRGYRLIGPVRVIEPPGMNGGMSAPSASPPIVETASATPAPAARWTQTRAITAAAVVIVVVGLALASWVWWQRTSSIRYSLAAETRAAELRRQGNARGAAEELREAIRLNPGNARAYAALAHALQAISPELTSAVRPQGQSPSVREAARGVEIDPQCGGCQGTLAFFLFYHDWQWAQAEERFQLAIRLAPDDASIRPAYAMLLAVTGHPARAVEQVDIGLREDPYRLSWLGIRASALYFDRRYEEAIAAADRALVLASKDRGAWDWRSKALFQLGRGEEAIRALAQSTFEHQSADLDRAVRDGGVEAGLRLLLSITDDWRGRIEHAWRRAAWRALLNDRDGAIDELQRATDMRRFNAINIAADPVYDSLRCHPRYEKLVASMGLQGVTTCRLRDVYP
jgi:DNA-binding winged helix-turn-helix (wHTH) protein/Flp pilus assembly protein TadD